MVGYCDSFFVTAAKVFSIRFILLIILCASMSLSFTIHRRVGLLLLQKQQRSAPFARNNRYFRNSVIPAMDVQPSTTLSNYTSHHSTIDLNVAATVSALESTKNKSRVLEGSTFAITGTLSVSRAEFEAFILKHGGKVAKSVTNSVTHLVSAETGTKKCQDAEDKGATIVNEDWVRKRVANANANAGDSKDDTIPAQSFVPLLTYIDDLLATDEDEGRCVYNGGKK